MATLLVVGAYIAIFNLQPIFLIAIAIMVATAGLFLSWKLKKTQTSGIQTLFRKGAWLSVFAPMYVLYFEAKDLFGSQFSYRLGPDNLGWATSSAYLCRGKNIEELSSSVQAQIGATDIIESFEKPVPIGVFSINRISSYTDQVAAEFLIGAHRTGGPESVASLCQIIGIDYFGAIFLAFILWSFFILALLIRAYGIEKGINPYFAAVIASIAAINVNLLSVTFEGGFGQTLTLPYFLAAVIWISRSAFSLKQWFAISALLVVAAASTYLDVLYLAAPFLLGALFIRLLIWKDVKFNVGKETLLVILLTVVSIIPILPHVYRLAIGPILKPSHGGWDQGNFPMLDNVIGIASRLPNGITTSLESRNTEEWLWDIALSIIVIWIFAITFKKFSVPFIPIFLGYLWLVYSIYLSNPEAMNNYRIWKYSEYAAIFFSIVIIDALAKSNIFPWRPKVQKISPFLKNMTVIISVTALLLVQFFTSIIWSLDWYSTRSMTLSASGVQQLAPYFEKYDIEVICGGFATDYSIWGDIRYVARERGGGKVQRTIPRREKIFLTPEISMKTVMCTDNYFSLQDRNNQTILESSPEFQLILVNSSN